MSSPPTTPYVAIVGAGPAGLLLAILLSKHGIPVQLLEKAKDVDPQPRATHYAPVAVRELIRAGVIDKVRAKGFDPTVISWRLLDEDRTVLAGLDGGVVHDSPERMVCLGLNDLSAILLEELEKQPCAKVSWDHEVQSLGQDGEKAWVVCKTPEGEKTITARYIVGCDGANSVVRRKLFGEMEFPGFTWEEQIVATNVYYPFDKYGYTDSQFFIHPDHWHMVARISRDGLYRVTYGEIPGLSREQLRERLEWKYSIIMPGKEEYRMTNFSPYRVHQRLAPRMRVGRFCLAADAAHLCNPFGGQGLTSGMVDVGGLYDCLAGIYTGQADDGILEKYDEVRRQKYREFVDPISTGNIKRLWQEPSKALEVDPFLQLCKQLETDEELARKLHLDMSLAHDFTQYYRSHAETEKDAAPVLAHDSTAVAVSVGGD